MVGLIRAEWLKITRQNTSRLMAAMLIGIAGLFVLISVANVTGTGSLANRQTSFDRLSFPTGLNIGVRDIIGKVGVLIVAVLVANVVGNEYGLDTWKNLLVRHQGRGRFMAAKLVVVGAVLLGIFVVTTLATQLFSSLGGAVVANQATQAGLISQNVNTDQFYLNLYSQSVSLLFYFGVVGAFATLFTVIGRSTVTGIIVPLVLWVGDSFSLQLLGPTNFLSNITVNKNVSSVQANLFQNGSGSIILWQSLLLLGFYMLIPTVAAFILFRQRDMAG